tara:strand:- start:2831 stop:4021 length:1191 start_codon:yes stop_codon:yes gene_type:complete
MLCLVPRLLVMQIPHQAGTLIPIHLTIQGQIKMGKKDDTNYEEVALIQGEANKESIRDQNYANRPTQYTPYGSTNWNTEQVIDPTTGEPVTAWTQTTSLSPELQYILNQQQGIASGKGDIAGMLVDRMGSEFSTEMDWNSLSPMGEVPMAQYTRPENQVQSQFTSANPNIESPYATRQAAENAVYSQAQSRIAPQQEGQREALELKMRNQGLNPEDAAWQSQMQGQAQGFNDQNNQALWSANQAGRQESDSMYGQLMGQNQNAFNQNMGANNQNFNQMMGINQNTFNQNLGANAQNYGQAMGNSQYANQIRQQQMTEAMTQRGFSLNEINALMSGGQVGLPQMPNFSQAEAAQPADFQGAAAQQASANAANNPGAALLGVGADLGAAYLGNSNVFK